MPPLQDVYSEISSLVKRRVAVDAAAGIPEAAALVKYTQGGWGAGSGVALLVLGGASSSRADSSRPALLCSSHCAGMQLLPGCAKLRPHVLALPACLPPPYSPSLLLPCSGPQAGEANGDDERVWSHLCGRPRAGEHTVQQPELLLARSAATAINSGVFM